MAVLLPDTALPARAVAAGGRGAYRSVPDTAPTARAELAEGGRVAEAEAEGRRDPRLGETSGGAGAPPPLVTPPFTPRRLWAALGAALGAVALGGALGSSRGVMGAESHAGIAG